MNKIYDLSKEEPLSPEDAAAIRVEAQSRFERTARRAFYATLAFFLCCTDVVLFCEGFPFHRYWPMFGKPIVICAEIMLVVWVVHCGFLWTAWVYRRDIEKSLRESTSWLQGP
jgi:hypothetical protein